MNRFRTDVEDLLLREMVEEDSNFIMMEDCIDGIIPENNKGLFDDSSSEDDLFGDDLDDLLNGEDLDLF